MARRSLEDKNIRSLTKVSGGASYGITIPREYIRNLISETIFNDLFLIFRR